MPKKLPPTIAMALALGDFHTKRLVAEKGRKAGNFNPCYACGNFLYADIYGNSAPHYRVNVGERRIILCEECGERLQKELKEIQ
jgi:hypothetical protein